MRYLIALLLALPFGFAQQAPEPSFRTTTSEVLLDVVVRDKHAKIIRDLRPEEIQVFEDGVPQKMRHFEFADGRSVAPPSPKPLPVSGSAANPAPGTAPSVPPTINELRDISVVSIVIANLDPRGRKTTFDAISKFVRTELRPNMYVGVFTLGMAGLRPIQPYTNDGEKISAAVERATKSALDGQLVAVNQFSMQNGGLGTADSASLESSDPNIGSSTDYTSSVEAGPAAVLAAMIATQWVSEIHDVYMDSQLYLTPLQSLVQAQAQIPGRKVVLLFSAGLPVAPDTTELLRHVISTANRSNVSIYALDTRGTTVKSTLDDARRRLQAAVNASRRQQLALVNGSDQMITPDMVVSGELAETSIHSDAHANLTELAEDTGGELLPDSLDLLDPLKRAVEDVQTHYELTYSPTNPVTDGSFRKIEVKVSRPGAKIFARSGYYALPLLNGRQIYPFEMATLNALNKKPALHQFDFRVTALHFRPGTERNQLAFVFQAPAHDLSIAKDGEWAKVHVCVTALIKDEQGRVAQKISKDIPYRVPTAKLAELQQGIVSFTAPFSLAPGHYTVETATVDRQSMKASVSRMPLEVSQAYGLTMSDVSIARRVDAIAGPDNTADPLQARGGTVTPELSNTLTRAADGKLQLYAVAYPPAPIDAPVDANIEIYREGKLVMRSPASVVPPDASGAASILASLPTTDLTAGHYEAEVLFQYKGETVMRKVAFTLASGT